MPGNPDEDEPPVADREVLPPPDSHEEANEEEEEEADSDDEPDAENEDGPESEPGDRTIDDPTQAPQVDLTESWTDGPPEKFQASGDDDGPDDGEDDAEAGGKDGDETDGEVDDDEDDGAEDVGADDEEGDGGDGEEGADEDEGRDDEKGDEEDDSEEGAGEDEGRDDDKGDEEDDSEEDDEDDVEDGDVDDDNEEGDEDEPDFTDGTEKVDFHDDATPIQRKTGPTSDQEQPLADHIEEMIRRLAVVVVVAGLVSLLAFPFGEDFIVFLWYSVLPADISQPHVYHPLELVITQLKAASLLGLVLALPVFVYETYAFMRPGLYPHERRYYLSAVPTSLILASIGLLFGYFLVLPAVMTYFLYYSRDVVDIAFALGQTFNLMLILLGYLALVFQIPLFIMLAIMMGLTTRTWLEDRRLIFWGAFLGISFLFSPDPTGMAPILVGATMIALFEGTLLLLRWTKRGG